MWQLLQVSCLLGLTQAADAPFVLQEESVLMPRGRRFESRCWGMHCGVGAPLDDTLINFPPGRPTENNIDNICERSRVKSNYGPHNLPQRGFGHLSRQGDAINQLEKGFTACCLQSQRLSCAQDLWKDVLYNFCREEFSIKTLPYDCCEESDSTTYSCFERQAPYPNYDSPVPPAFSDEDNVNFSFLRHAKNPAPCPTDGTSGTSECHSKNSNEALEKKMKELFPPGEPNADSIENICRLRKFRSNYLKNVVPRSYFGQQQRQAKAINQLEAQFKKCCKNEDVSCAHDAWEKVLEEFCDDEVSVKTRHHECCKEQSSTAMYSCFSSKAPHPNYDWEIQTLSLSELHQPVLQLLCGEMKLLSKQKQISLLVKEITENCCWISSEDRVGCAEQKREESIETLCTSKRSSWKDNLKCCEQEDRVSCFSRNYLDKVSIAAANTEVENNKQEPPMGV
ncbi:extracellular matrix protein 1-like isoform X2 [Microcaecilia unicolor]|uniref:Extracellular matrix protein 1-like isoform X2 n=1 Tax=Microcaecilia unicolor TaxID=1415580 RepID=A0A6P7X0U5_9AMPH|nr:extracellular matrix protein 1-like isoform X2 [Microcaecilia unicolor]